MFVCVMQCVSTPFFLLVPSVHPSTKGLRGAQKGKWWNHLYHPNNPIHKCLLISYQGRKGEEIDGKR